MEEMWKPIANYENNYEVSNYGRIRNISQVVIMPNGGYYISESTINKPTSNGKGYGRVFLCKNNKVSTKYVHRLVASAWCINALNYNEVNHIDGNKENNNASNLEWVTRKQNVQHSRRTGLFAPSRTKLSINIVDDIIALRKRGVSREIVSEKYKIAKTTISCITTGKTWNWHTNIKQ